MTMRVRKWAGLGVSAAALGVAACSESADVAEPEETIVATPAAVSGEGGAGGEAGEGEGGEGEAGAFDGEGGVDVARAAEDPVLFLAALSITEAHVLAARDAFAAGRTRAAAEMFAHPVSEVLFAMQPVFEAQGVTPFDAMLTEASAAALSGESAEDIAARAEAIVVALEAAAARAPESDDPPGRIAAARVADMIERAAYQYRIAGGSDAYEPYLDGYGFLAAGRAAYQRDRAAIAEQDAAVDALIQEAFDTLASAYPSAERPDALGADQGALNAASTQLLLALQAG